MPQGFAAGVRAYHFLVVVEAGSQNVVKPANFEREASAVAQAVCHSPSTFLGMLRLHSPA